MIVPGYVSSLPSVGIEEQTKQNKTKKQSQNKQYFFPILSRSPLRQRPEIKTALGQEINGERPLQNLDVSLCSSQ